MEQAVLYSLLVLCFAAMVSAKCTKTGEECRDLLRSRPPFVYRDRLSCHRYSAMRTKCCGEPHNPRVALASVCALSGTDAMDTGFDRPQLDSAYPVYGDQCRSEQERSVIVQLSDVWGDASVGQANSIRQGRLNVCLYPTRNQSGRHRVTLSARAYFKPDQHIGTSNPTKFLTGTKNGAVPKCGQRPITENCRFRNEIGRKLYEDCVWKKIDVTDAIKQAIQKKQSHVKFVVKMDQTSLGQSTEQQPTTCFSYNGPTQQVVQDSTRPFITFKYRKWNLRKHLNVQINRAPDNTKMSSCDFGGKCQLRRITLNFTTLAKSSDDFSIMDSERVTLASGFYYNICAGHCNAKEKEATSIGEIYDQPQNTCATVYDSEPKKIHGRYKWEHGAVTMHFKQWSAKECYCNTYANATREMLDTDKPAAHPLLTSTS